MIGLILWQTPGKRQRSVELGEELVLHMRFLCVRVAPGRPGALRRRIRTAGKLLYRAGVRQAVLPANFPCGEQLETCGIHPVSTLPLRRSLAAELVRASLEPGTGLGGARLAVVGEYLTGELVRAVTELSLRSRYILLDLPCGGEDLCRQLRREYGVAVQLNPVRELLETADALVLFDRREDLRGRNAVLPLYDDSEDAPLPELLLPPVLEDQLPTGCDRIQLLAALWESGVLRPGQITVGSAASTPTAADA